MVYIVSIIMIVVVVEGFRAVPLLALAVREPADEEQVIAFEQTDAVLQRESESGVEFVRNIREACGREPCNHPITRLPGYPIRCC